MIRLVLLALLVGLFFLLQRANHGNLVTIHWINRTTPDLPVVYVLLYSFLAGAMAYALFTLPERFKTWRALRQNRRSLKKMGKSLGTVISNAKSSDK